jgi:hypothetical protein
MRVMVACQLVSLQSCVTSRILAGLLPQRDHVLAERQTEIVVLDNDRDRFELEIPSKQRRLALLRVSALH